MSATRDAQRTGELDAYLTPDAVARACVSRLPLGPGVTVWEPHAGGGAFLRAVADTGAGVLGTDLDPAAGYPVHDALRGDRIGARRGRNAVLALAEKAVAAYESGGDPALWALKSAELDREDALGWTARDDDEEGM